MNPLLKQRFRFFIRRTEPKNAPRIIGTKIEKYAILFMQEHERYLQYQADLRRQQSVLCEFMDYIDDLEDEEGLSHELNQHVANYMKMLQGES